MDRINLGELTKSQQFQINEGDVSLTVKRKELPEEVSSRLKMEEAKNKLDRQKDLILHIAGLLVLSTALILSLALILRTGSTPEEKQWAFQIMTAIITGFLGYLVGKATSKDK